MAGFHPANFGRPRPFRCRVKSRHATDGRTDTGHHNDPFSVEVVAEEYCLRLLWNCRVVVSGSALRVAALVATGKLC